MSHSPICTVNWKQCLPPGEEVHEVATEWTLGLTQAQYPSIGTEKGPMCSGHTARKSNIRRGAEGTHEKSTDSEWVPLCLLVFQVVVSLRYDRGKGWSMSRDIVRRSETLFTGLLLSLNIQVGCIQDFSEVVSCCTR